MKSILILLISIGTLSIYAQTPTLVIPKGHTAIMSSSACSADGKYIITGSRDLTAKLWDSKGTEIISYTSRNEVQAVAISNDTKLVLIGAADNNVQLLKITGERIKLLSDHRNFVNTVSFSPSNDFIATGADDGLIILYDLNGSKIRTITHAKAVKSVCFDSKGKLILSASSDRTAVLRNINGQVLKTFIGHSSGLNQAKISKDGNYIVTCSDDKTAILWDKNAIKKHSIRHFDRVTACDISSDNKTIITASYNGEVKIWDTSGKLLHDLDTKNWDINSITIYPDGKSFIITGSEGIIQYDINGKFIRNYQGRAKPVSAVCFSSNGKSILQGDLNGTLKIWDAYNNTFNVYKQHKSGISSIASSPDKNHFVTGSSDKTAVLWTADGKVDTILKLQAKVTSVNFSPDGNYILAGCYDGCTAIYSITGVLKKIIKQPGEQISSSAYSPDGNQIVTASYSKKISFFDKEGNFLKYITAPSQVNSLTITSDSKSLIAGYFNGLTQIWDIATGESIENIGNPTGDEVLSADGSPNNIYIASGTNSGKILVEDLKTHDEFQLNGHQTKVNSVKFSPDGKTLISGSSDGTIKLWDCESKKEIISFIALDQSDWVITSPSGLFDASTEAMIKLKYRVGLEMIDLEQLKERYYEPGLLSSIFKVQNTQLRDVSTFNSVPLYPEINAKIVGEELLVNLTSRSGNLGKLSVFINDKEIIEDANPERNTEVKPIKLSNYNRYFIGDSNKIVLRTFNKEEWLKSPPFELIYKSYQGSRGNEGNSTEGNSSSFKGKRHLYAIIVGTSDYSGDGLDLIYPDKDARAFASALSQVGVKLFNENVHITLLTTSEKDDLKKSTRSNIEKAFKEVNQKATSEDIMVVYLSGHGVNYGQAEKSQFYYLTTDIKSDNLQEQAIRDAYTISSDNLTQWLKTSPSRRQMVVIDACHSGEVVKSLGSIGARELTPAQIKAFDRMKDRTGIFILTGSAGDRVSYESSQFGQGLLTYSLLEGMSGLAVTPGDKRVDIATLFNYSRDRVPELAKYINKIQKPVFTAPNGATSFDVGISDGVKIELIQPKPIFIQNTFQNANEGMDDLEIMKLMKEHLQELTSQGSDSPIVYSDVDAYPNAFRMSGLYTVEGQSIKINVNILKNKDKIASIKFDGTKSNIKAIIEGVFEKVYNEIQGK